MCELLWCRAVKRYRPDIGDTSRVRENCTKSACIAQPAHRNLCAGKCMQLASSIKRNNSNGPPGSGGILRLTDDQSAIGRNLSVACEARSDLRGRSAFQEQLVQMWATSGPGGIDDPL